MTHHPESAAPCQNPGCRARSLLRDSGVKPVVLPAWSPNLNAFAERFVESAESECLERLVLLGERHLRAAVQFVHHYHEEGPHQGLCNELPSDLLQVGC
jgi:putative transposase